MYGSLNPEENIVRKLNTGRTDTDMKLSGNFGTGRIFVGGSGYFGKTIYVANKQGTDGMELCGAFMKEGKPVFLKLTPSRTNEEPGSYMHEILSGKFLEGQRSREISKNQFYGSVRRPAPPTSIGTSIPHSLKTLFCIHSMRQSMGKRFKKYNP